MKKMIMFKFIIKKIVLVLFFCLAYSCAQPPTVSLLVSNEFLNSIDSIKTQTPYRVTNIGNGYRLSNLPTKLRDIRNSPNQYDAWDEIVEEYNVESNVYIDTISKSKTIISRSVYKWLYNEDKRIKKRISIEEFKQLLIDEGIKSEDFKILVEKERKYDDGIKNTFLELRYKGTVNKIRLKNKGTISNTTYLVSQIPYWESQGLQFSTTTAETIEKYQKK